MLGSSDHVMGDEGVSPVKAFEVHRPSFPPLSFVLASCLSFSRDKGRRKRTVVSLSPVEHFFFLVVRQAKIDPKKRRAEKKDACVYIYIYIYVQAKLT